VKHDLIDLVSLNARRTKRSSERSGEKQPRHHRRQRYQQHHRDDGVTEQVKMTTETVQRSISGHIGDAKPPVVARMRHAHAARGRQPALGFFRDALLDGLTQSLDGFQRD
jgi:hypothetical protein